METSEHDSYADATALATTIRDLLADPKMLDDIINSLPENKRPPYWKFLDKKNGMSAVVMAQLLKAAGGDTAAAGFLAKYGWGDKLQVDVSSFYSDRTFEIEVVEPKKIDINEPQVIEAETVSESSDAEES